MRKDSLGDIKADTGAFWAIWLSQVSTPPQAEGRPLLKRIAKINEVEKAMTKKQCRKATCI